MMMSAAVMLFVIFVFLLEVVQNHLLKLLSILYLGTSIVALSLALLYVFLAVRVRAAVEKARVIT